MKNIFTLLLLLAFTPAFGQSDTTDVKALINSNFPNNTSNYITPLRLRQVSLELMRSYSNLFEENTFSESLTVEDSIYSDVGFFKWNGSSYTEVGGGSSNWGRSGGFISPLTFTDKLNVDTARIGGNFYPDGVVNIGRSTSKFDTVFANVFDGVSAELWEIDSDTLKPTPTYSHLILSAGNYSYEFSELRAVTTYANGDTIVKYGGELARFGVLSNIGADSASISLNNGRFVNITSDVVTITGRDRIEINSDTISVQGDMSISDTLFAGVINTQYGEMGFRDSSRVVALTIDVPSWITNASNDLWSQSASTIKGVVYDGDSLIVASDGVYHISGHISVSGTNGDVLRAYVENNGIAMCLCSPISSLTTNRIIVLPINSDISPLSAGDVLKVFVENIGTSNDVAAISGKLTVHKVN